MGTNYYWTDKLPCETCGREYEDRHIGKSSSGWVFALHVYPEDDINSLEDWKKKLENGIIKDEYGGLLSKEEMLDKIINRSGNDRKKSVDFYYENQACEGPNGLIRSKIDGHHCIGYGSGTWDLHIGDFS